MSQNITLTFTGKNELLLRAIEAYQQSDLFEDEEGNSVQMTREEIALNMLLEGCVKWVQDIPGLPEDLDEELRVAFDICDEECDDCDCDDEACGHEESGDLPHYREN